MRKILSLFVMAGVFVFAGAGASYAEGEAVEAMTADEQNCIDSGGTWENNDCVCSGEHMVSDSGVCKCASGWVLEEKKCVAVASGTGREACEAEGSNGAWTNDECVCTAGDLFNSTTGQCYKADAESLQAACENSGGTYENSCVCEKDNSRELNGVCVCARGYTLTGENVSSLKDANAKCEIVSGGNNEQGGSGNGGQSGGNATGGIRLATTSFNNTQFTPVQTRLNTTIGTIKDVVAQAIANSASVSAVSSTKQDRPDDLKNCAAGKTCLLVTDTAGANNWYEIVDCSADNVLSGVGFDGQNVRFGPGEPWGWKITGESGGLMCRSGDGLSCPDDTWVASYDKNSSHAGDEIVFGVMRRVAIAERTRGSIVTLPNSVQSGDVCVCKATKYKLWNSGTSSYGDDNTITTDKWFVAGSATTDDQCFSMCGDDRMGGISKEAYYRNIANTCSANATTANMCRYYQFFNNVVNNYFDRRTQDQSSVSYAYGDVQANGNAWAGCNVNDNGVSVRDTNHCTVDQSGRLTWVIRYYRFNNYTSPIGYVYGFGGYASVPAGTATGDVVDVNVANVSSDSSGNNAAVCVIKGYKANSDASDTEFTTSKAYVYAVGEGYDNAGIGGSACTEASMHMFRELYADMGNTCFAY